MSGKLRWRWTLIYAKCPVCGKEFRPWYYDPLREMDEKIKDWNYCPFCGTALELPKCTFVEDCNKPKHLWEVNQ